MNPKSKIIVYIAISADGYIARPDDNLDWLQRPHPPGKYGMPAFFRSIDTIIWGRKTYEVSLGLGGPGLFGPNVKHYVFSRRAPGPLTPRVQFVNEPVRALAKRLRARSGKNIWIMGGAQVIGAFLDEGEIDEFSIHVIPVFIGEGIPLVQPRHRFIPLELISTRRFRDGVVHLNYRLVRKRQKRSRKIT
jgi:dihydrofolate reductase